MQLEAECSQDRWTKTLAVCPSLKTDASPMSLAGAPCCLTCGCSAQWSPVTVKILPGAEKWPHSSCYPGGVSITNNCLESRKDNFMKREGGGKGQTKEAIFRRKRSRQR